MRSPRRMLGAVPARCENWASAKDGAPTPGHAMVKSTHRHTEICIRGHAIRAIRSKTALGNHSLILGKDVLQFTRPRGTGLCVLSERGVTSILRAVNVDVFELCLARSR